MANPHDFETIHHVARLAFLAMSARAVASTEFETSPEVAQIRILVTRPVGADQPAVDLEFVGPSGFPLGGMSV